MTPSHPNCLNVNLTACAPVRFTWLEGRQGDCVNLTACAVTVTGVTPVSSHIDWRQGDGVRRRQVDSCAASHANWYRQPDCSCAVKLTAVTSASPVNLTRRQLDAPLRRERDCNVSQADVPSG